MSARERCAPCAPTVVTNIDGVGVLSKIVDCARMRFSSVSNRRFARTGRRRRKFKRHSSTYLPASANVCARTLRAPRANRVFRTDEKHIRTENAVMDKTKDDGRPARQALLLFLVLLDQRIG
jgi:hypothetical protein